MSDKKIETFCLVIDASIAHAAGGLDSKHPRGMLCRDFLMRLRGICHRMAWGERIEAEWNKHKSAFASQWLVSMNNLRKLIHLDDTPPEELAEAIAVCHDDEGVIRAMEKDAHLLAGAFKADGRITCLDEKVRRHFALHLRDLDTVQSVVWVNPLIEDETAIGWLEAGTPLDVSRQLRKVQ